MCNGRHLHVQYCTCIFLRRCVSHCFQLCLLKKKWSLHMDFWVPKMAISHRPNLRHVIWKGYCSRRPSWCSVLHKKMKTFLCTCIPADTFSGQFQGHRCKKIHVRHCFCLNWKQCLTWFFPLQWSVKEQACDMHSDTLWIWVKMHVQCKLRLALHMYFCVRCDCVCNRNFKKSCLDFLKFTMCNAFGILRENACAKVCFLKRRTHVKWVLWPWGNIQVKCWVCTTRECMCNAHWSPLFAAALFSLSFADSQNSQFSILKN